MPKSEASEIKVYGIAYSFSELVDSTRIVKEVSPTLAFIISRKERIVTDANEYVIKSTYVVLEGEIFGEKCREANRKSFMFASLHWETAMWKRKVERMQGR